MVLNRLDENSKQMISIFKFIFFTDKELPAQSRG